MDLRLLLSLFLFWELPKVSGTCLGGFVAFWGVSNGSKPKGGERSISPGTCRVLVGPPAILCSSPIYPL